ncbi:MAG: hypothetical protein AABY27_04355 [Pseudomonadota bacterium]
MVDLIEEIDADIKEEKRALLISRLVRIFIIVAISIIIAVASYVWRKNDNLKLQEKLGDLYNKAIISMENNKDSEAVDYFNQVINSSHHQYAALAYFMKASIQFKLNQFEEGQKTLLNIVNTKDFDIAFRDLAKATYLGNKLEKNEEVSTEIHNSLNDLSKENKPWYLLALQLKAMYNIKGKNYDSAKASLNEIMSSKNASKFTYDIASSTLASIPKTK